MIIKWWCAGLPSRRIAMVVAVRSHIWEGGITSQCGMRAGRPRGMLGIAEIGVAGGGGVRSPGSRNMNGMEGLRAHPDVQAGDRTYP
jgi:hypothetical protein